VGPGVASEVGRDGLVSGGVVSALSVACAQLVDAVMEGDREAARVAYAEAMVLLGRLEAPR
jgi:dihydrodipicolinate synthase/N-acetylneuraminate lyase